jgi:hypothetical protein
MTFYAFILFVHIASAFILFGALLLESLAFGSLRRTADASALRQWIPVAAMSPRLSGPASGLILLSGAYLGHVLKAWDQAWLSASLIALVAAGIIGLSVTSPRIRVLSRIPVAGGIISADLRTRVQDPVLLASVRVRLALVLAILLVMVGKVNLGASLLIIVSALLLGLAASVPLWKHRTKLAENA